MSLTVEKCLQAWTNSLRQMNSKADIVFFGDSLTYYGDFSSVFPDKVVFNLGLRGDTIQGMIDRVEQVKMLEPNIVYLMGGINDVSVYNFFEFKQQYEILVKKICSSMPSFILVLQSLTPVNNSKFKISCTNEDIILCNLQIRQLALDYKLNYLDLYSKYALSGELPLSLTEDGIHLKEEAYVLWYNILRENTLI